MITTEKRTRDWIAFANGNRRIWEAGRTEEEAAGKLVLRLQKEAAQPARSEAGDCEHVELTCADPGVILPSEIGTPCPICGLPRR